MAGSRGISTFLMCESDHSFEFVTLFCQAEHHSSSSVLRSFLSHFRVVFSSFRIVFGLFCAVLTVFFCFFLFFQCRHQHAAIFVVFLAVIVVVVVFLRSSNNLDTPFYRDNLVTCCVKLSTVAAVCENSWQFL